MEIRLSGSFAQSSILRDYTAGTRMIKRLIFAESEQLQEADWVTAMLRTAAGREIWVKMTADEPPAATSMEES